MTGKVRLAVMGAGLIGRRHVATIAQSDTAILSAIIDPAHDAAPFAAANNASCYPDLSELLRADRPEGIIIATPNQLHHVHALTAIAAGIPVLIEKPLADTADAAAAIVAAAAKAGVAALTGHHRRHSLTLQKAKAIVAAGTLGRVITAHAACWFYKPDPYFDAHWRREAGAGPTWLNLIHDVDNLRFLLGDVLSVQAMESHAARGFAVEDSAVVLLRFACGALATLTVSDTVVSPWSWELTSGENPDYPHTNQNCYLIGGDHASLAIPSLDIWSCEGTRSWTAPTGAQRAAADFGDPIARQIAHFCAVIRGTEAPVCSAQDGLASLKVIAAIKQAAVSGAAVAITQQAGASAT